MSITNSIDDPRFKSYFMSRVQVTETCWIWQGSRSDGGYSGIKLNRKTSLVHRVSYQLFRGPIPEGLLVLHTCDNPPCVRPDHLFLGTQEDNVRDCAEKGRRNTARGARNGANTHPERLCRGEAWLVAHPPEKRAKGATHGFNLHPELLPRGEKHWKAKITEAQALELRRRFAQGETQTALAREYGVSQAHVSKIIRGLTWAHVKPT